MQHRAAVFDRQLGQSVSDAYIVDMAYARMSSKYGKTSHGMLSSLGQSTGLSSQGARKRLLVDTHGYQISDLLPATPCFDPFHTKEELFSVEMIRFLIHHYAAGPASENPLIGPGSRQFHRCLFLSTEYKRAGTIFCGHADYRHNGPWYDWVMLRWAREDNQQYTGDPEYQAAYGDDPTIAIKHLYAPGQILGFVCPTPVDWINDHQTPESDGVIFLIPVNQCFPLSGSSPMFTMPEITKDPTFSL
jgi:hypothetical protein